MNEPPPINLEYRAKGLRIRDIGNDGLIVAVDDGRGDDWPAAHVEAEDAKLLRQFLGRDVTAQDRRALETFSAWLDAACGGQHHLGIRAALARALGVMDCCVNHWRTGECLPSEEEGRAIARFFHASPGLLLPLLREERRSKPGRDRPRGKDFRANP